jgi:hypothetical protein
VASGVGVALLVTVVSAASPAGATGAALVPAFHQAYLTAAVVSGIGVLIALTIRDSDAAATMRPREQRPASSAPSPAAVPPQIAEGTADPG